MQSGRKEQVRTICGICPAGCWVVAGLDESGRITTVRADEVSSLGMICKLGEHSAGIVYSPDRLLYPMKRRGPKGSYDFVRISWEEAYNEIVGRLVDIKTRYGPEATSVYTGRGSFELAMCDVYQPRGVRVSSASSVLFPFGSPNTMGVGALCYVSFAMIAPHVTMGGMLVNMFSDIENAGLIVVWGANPATDCPPLDLKRIVDAHGRGVPVVAIDPRRTMTAKLTDAQWIPLRPGTDGALALSLCNVLIKEELYDEDFVRNWTLGFEDFARYVQHFHPETVEGITGVKAGTIRTLARAISDAKGAAPVMYSGLEYSDGGVQAIRATQVLWALAGQLDVPGGRCFTMRENHFKINREGHVANPNMSKALGRDRFPVYSSYRGESHAMALPDSVLNGNPYRIRSLIILGGSIITAWPEPQLWRRTLGGLDFLVCIDRQLTADAAYADIVLPATTMYEIDSYMIYGPLLRLREKLIEPVGEARNDFFIIAELASRLGYGHLYPQTTEELLRHVLKGSGFTLEDVKNNGAMAKVPTVMMQYKKWEKGLLRDDGKPGFATPSGKFEIASTILEESGYDPLPVYTEPAEGPLTRSDLTGEFPLVFNSGARVTTDFRSQHHGVEPLWRERPEPAVTINTMDAGIRGIQNGDSVVVKTPRGKVGMRAIVTDDIVEGAIDANMGGGGPTGPYEWQRCNVNDLTDVNRYDPISGFPVYKALLCDVVKSYGNVSPLYMGSGEYDGSNAGRPIGSNSDEGNGSGQNAGVLGGPERVYLDNNATTIMSAEVRELMLHVMEKEFGNPSSIYKEGRSARFIVESARRSVAMMLNTTAKRIVFTAGGSEANNLAIKGVFLAAISDCGHRQFSDEGKRPFADRKFHAITSTIEHPSVLKAFRWLEGKGVRVTYLPVDKAGLVELESLAAALTDDTFLVSVMMANNETGAVQPIAGLAALARQRGALLHSDCVQAAGKLALDVEEQGVDLLTLSAHKFHGPKGIGALYIRKGVPIEPLVSGGMQEGGLRAGTENVAAIAGFGKAAELAVKNLLRWQDILAYRDALESGIARLIGGAVLIGPRQERLPNTLCMLLPNMRGESIVLAMDQKGISLSSGSACRSGSPEPSHALLAMGKTHEEAHCAVRFSLSVNSTSGDVDKALAALAGIVKDTADMVRFVSCR